MAKKIVKKCNNCRHFVGKTLHCVIDNTFHPKYDVCKHHGFEKEIKIEPGFKQQIVQIFNKLDLLENRLNELETKYKNGDL